jgi:hypothetical protein
VEGTRGERVRCIQSEAKYRHELCMACAHAMPDVAIIHHPPNADTTVNRCVSNPSHRDVHVC